MATRDKPSSRLRAFTISARRIRIGKRHCPIDLAFRVLGVDLNIGGFRKYKAAIAEVPRKVAHFGNDCFSVADRQVAQRVGIGRGPESLVQLDRLDEPRRDHQ